MSNISYLRKILDKIKKIGHIKEYNTNANILTEGEKGNTIFFLLEGEVKVVIYNEAGKEITLNTLKAINFFGEIGMLGETERTATIIANTKCKVITVSRENFIDFIKEERETFFMLLLEMAKRLKDANRKIYILSLNKATERVECYLRDKIFNNFNKSNILLPSHSEISKELGLTRETVTKILGELKEKGIISGTKGKITINKELLFYEY